MANMRVSELVQITVPEMVAGDLLLVSDINANQSKKLTVGDLGTFLIENGLLTGSFNGTSSYALVAATASYVVPGSASYAPTSSWALNVSTASYALTATSAANSVTSSYVVTASYALFASVQSVFSASFAGNAQTASFLFFTPGETNGTASSAITASYALKTSPTSSFAITASYVLGLVTQVSASYAQTASIANTASYAQTSTYLQFNGVPNGTSSYALAAAYIAGVTSDFGTYAAITQSLSSSQLDMVFVSPSLAGYRNTNFEALGTICVPFTSSNGPTNGTIQFFVVDRQNGGSQSLDSTSIYVNLASSSSISGTFKYPFSLAGDVSLSGSYELYVTASNGVFIEPSRNVKFKITSQSDVLKVQSSEPIQFYTTPSNIVMGYSSSLNPATAYVGSASQVIFSGSNDPTVLVVPAASGMTSLSYTWTLINLTYLNTIGNSSITNIGGAPSSLLTMSVASCSILAIPHLGTSSVQILDCSNNNINGVLELAPSMSYVNVSNNPNLILPSYLPQGLTSLWANQLSILSTPTTIPDTLQTMSMASCTSLNSWASLTFPLSIGYFDCHSTSIASLPTFIPSHMLYCDVSYCQMTPTTIGNICSGLVSNALSNGTLKVIGNPSSQSAPSIVTNIATLVSRGWTVVS